MGDTNAPILTSPYLSKYECARVIGLRVLQLQEEHAVSNPLRTAIQEVLERKNPSIIRRYLPNGTHEDVSISTLHFDRFLLRYQLNLETLDRNV